MHRDRDDERKWEVRESLFEGMLFGLPKDNKESAHNAGDLGSIPGVGRCTRE